MKHFGPMVLALVTAIVGHAQAGEVTAKGELRFEQHIRPILKAHCFRCHGEAGEIQGGLDVRLQRLMIKGGESGPAITPHQPDESYLLDRITSGEMPPGDLKLSQQELASIQDWIAAGAKTARPEPESLDGPIITPEERSYWAFQPVTVPPIPSVEHSTQVQTPIDAFLLQKLEAAGLKFSPPADKRTLIRRVTFDLLGLPPTPEDVAAFVADDTPGAYEKLLDRLLESPQYGERWGRHWLDVAGYSDSEGYTEVDLERQWAFKYRDYVIRSFNADMPFDRFIQEQLAGDEIVSPPYNNLTPDQAEKLVATGFLRMAPDGTADADVDQVAARNEVISKSLQIVSTALLGMTVGCAECHDHRYDPIPQKDYFQFRAIFEPAYNSKTWRVPNARRILLWTDAERKQIADIEAEAKSIDTARLARQAELLTKIFETELAKLPEDVREPLRAAYTADVKERTPEQVALLKKHSSVNVTAAQLSKLDEPGYKELVEMVKKAADLRKTKPPQDFARALTEVPGQVPETFLNFRGDPNQPRDAVVPAGLTVLSADERAREIPGNDESLPTSGRRLAYARRLTDGTHPLTARVLVNRFWMHHFGRGIVATPGDFGILGTPPTHPELLDWLANDFVQGGWKLKRFHRMLMTSTAYQQQLRSDSKQDAMDPDNTLYGGMRLRRLEAEVVRDAILAISGKLNLKPFGKPVPVMADRVGQYVVGIENVNAGRPGPVLPLHGEEFRRSIYVLARRSRPLAVMDTFDLPRMDPNCEIRASSTVAPQSLMLMNNDFVLEHAEHFAKRLQEEAGEETPAQIDLAWQLVFGRSPTAEESSEAAEVIAGLAAYFAENPDLRKPPKAIPKNEYYPGLLQTKQQALAGFCQVLISSNQFLYVD